MVDIAFLDGCRQHVMQLAQGMIQVRRHTPTLISSIFPFLGYGIFIYFKYYFWLKVSVTQLETTYQHRTDWKPGSKITGIQQKECLKRSLKSLIPGPEPHLASCVVQNNLLNLCEIHLSHFSNGIMISVLGTSKDCCGDQIN